MVTNILHVYCDCSGWSVTVLDGKFKATVRSWNDSGLKISNIKFYINNRVSHFSRLTKFPDISMIFPGFFY